MSEIYISGQITGLPKEDVIKKFNDAKEYLLTQRWTKIVNPLDNGLPYEADWEDHLAKDISLMLDCEHIYLLPCWQKSAGARLERLIAIERGISIIYDKNDDERM